MVNEPVASPAEHLEPYRERLPSTVVGRTDRTQGTVPVEPLCRFLPAEVIEVTRQLYQLDISVKAIIADNV